MEKKDQREKQKKLLYSKMYEIIVADATVPYEVKWHDKLTEREYEVLGLCKEKIEETSSDVMKNKVEVYDDGIWVYNHDEKLIGYIGLNKNSPLSFSFRKHFYAPEGVFTVGRFYERNETFWLLHEYHGLKIGGVPNQSSPEDRKYLKMSFDDYRDKKLREMLQIMFTQDLEMKEWLLSTDDAILGMSEPDDKFGLGNEILLDDKCFSSQLKKPWTWRNFGQNIVGIMVMGIRHELRKKKEESESVE